MSIERILTPLHWGALVELLKRTRRLAPAAKTDCLVDDPENSIQQGLEKITRRIQVDEHKCWLWQGAKDKHGYGWTSIAGRPVRLHRVSFTIFYGLPPMLVCHKCDVRHCFNPDHLFSGSPKDNVRDAMAKGKYTFRVLSESELAQLRSEHIPKHPQYGTSALSRKWGISEKTLRAIFRRA